MAAAPTYAQWLAKNRLTSSAGNAANWKRQYGTPAAPAAGPTPPATIGNPNVPPPPAFDPNYVDAQGQSDMSNLNADYGPNGRARAKATAAYNMAIKNNAAQRPGIMRQHDMGIDRVQNSSAARGMYNSGNRIVGQQREDVNQAEALSGIDRADEQAGIDQTGALSDADSQLATGQSGIYAQAGQRRVNAYQSSLGL